MGGWPVVEWSEHTHLSTAVLNGCISWHPKTVKVVTSKITTTHVIIMEKLEIL